MDKKHLMNLSRLRQLGPQQFTKKAKKKGKPFLIIFLSSSSWKKQKCLTFGWENSDRKLWNNRLLLRRPLVARPNTLITCISTSEGERVYPKPGFRVLEVLWGKRVKTSWARLFFIFCPTFFCHMWWFFKTEYV